MNQASIARISQGDQLEFAHLMSTYNSGLYSFARGFVNSSEVAEEIISDVFLKLWKNRGKLLEIEDLKNYLFIAVRNSCLTAIKRKKQNEIKLDELPSYYIDRIEVPKEEGFDSELIDALNEAIDCLPPKCKLVFSMAKLQGFKRKEIANVLNISEKTVEYHLKTAVTKLIEQVGNTKKHPTREGMRLLLLLFNIF
ncbi:RNA polymerase sigma-70 factor [Carboxylicivirga sediminis]|uniref:RNA polymerase sigma-70 factor n=1 Tax=Carboxylicivirga sediminis TaxID=2006564 RepID=A0A941F4N0_9BACT|nr:RNA polymerase sigma-70 factor [Carboxylicivirga sediminis]MBR8535868.1 RNA polymerase sigma-70 factor [Carboxylicivirga sediminis]